MKLAASFIILASAFAAKGAIVAGAGITVTGTTYYGPDQVLINLVNGSGLSLADDPTATHSENNNSAEQWHAGGGQGIEGGPPVVDDQVVTFDLGELYDLNTVYIWQHNQPGNFGRGVNQFDLLYSSDGVSYTAFANNLNLAISPGGNISAQSFAFSQANVRFVQIAIDSAHSGSANEYVGLAEVMFDGIAVPEPGSVALLAFAGAGIALRRRR